MALDFGIRKFFGLLLVATCGMGAEFLLALADTVIAGHLVGEDALAGINLLQPVFNLVQFTAALVGTGTAIRYAFESGRLDTRRADEMFSQGFWTILGFGTLLLLAFTFGRELFLGFFGADASVVACARAYWKWYAPCTLLLPMTLYLTSLVYADGDMRSCTLGYVALIGGNIVLSFFLCRRFGIAGCAMGTVVGNAFAVLCLAGHFLRKTNTLHVLAHFRWRDLLLVCRSSFGDASVSLCWSLLFFLLAKLVVVEFGSDMLPVLSVVLFCINLTLLFNGVSAAVQPVASVAAGEGNDRSLRRLMRVACLVAALEGLAAAGLFAAFPEWAVAFVGLDDPARAPVACSAVRLVSIGFLGAPFVFLFNSYYLYIERFALACAVTFVADILVYAAVCPPAAHFFGARGLWLSLGLSPLVAAGVFSLFLVLRYGWGRFPFLLSKARENLQHSVSFVLFEGSVPTDDALRAVRQEVSRALRGMDGGAAFADRGDRLLREVCGRIARANAGRRVHAEVSVDLTDGCVITFRDDGVAFDPTCADDCADGRHFLTTGDNRTVYRLSRMRADG